MNFHTVNHRIINFSKQILILFSKENRVKIEYFLVYPDFLANGANSKFLSFLVFEKSTFFENNSANGKICSRLIT